MHTTIQKWGNRQGLHNHKHSLILTLIVAALLLSEATISAQENNQTPKRVLAIFVFQQGLPWAYRIEESLRAAFAAQASFPIELGVEHADRSRFPEKTYLSKIVDLYRYKYARRKMDLVLAVGDASTDVLFEHDKALFGDVPIVVITTEQKKPPPDLLTPNMIPLVWGFDFARTVALIRNLLPKIKNLFVISGTSVTDQPLRSIVAKELEKSHGRFSTHYLDNFSAEDHEENET